MKTTCRHLAFLVQLGLVEALFGAAAPVGPSKDDAIVNAKQFHERLLKIAQIYPAYGRVDDDAHLGLEDCRAPNPARAHHSKSTDEATHGLKLYSLFARDRAGYLGTRVPSAVGQVIVKESWTSLEVKGKPKAEERLPPRQPESKRIVPPADLAPVGLLVPTHSQGVFDPYAEKAGKWYKADRRGELFIMMNLDPKNAGTADGWVYGTVSADGKTVTSAGRVASCVRCHETRPTRLFGISPRVVK